MKPLLVISTGNITERTAMNSVADVPHDGISFTEINQRQLQRHVDGLVRVAVE
jgi:hypothetical protein